MNALLVIAKQPTPGQTKTRLSPALGPVEAAQLYEGFLRDTLDIARAVPDVTRLIYYAPLESAPYFAEMAPDFLLTPQHGAGLGERLDYVLTRYLNDGFQRVVVLDSDSPTLPPAYVTQAFRELSDNEVVLGPCGDGGYYLIGLTRPQPRLLRKVQMSQPNVLRDTLALAEQAGLRVSLLPAWYDVDTEQELFQLQADLARSRSEHARHTRDLLAAMASPSRVQPRS
jgi:rSAM/selenodomain-associated transferase 1